MSAADRLFWPGVAALAAGILALATRWPLHGRMHRSEADGTGPDDGRSGLL